MTKNQYKPLPNGLFIEESTIEESNIDGQGLFTEKFIHRNTDLGVCHIEMRTYDMDSIIIRTPLGGFINHSSTPNCMRIQKDNAWHLVTMGNVLPGEELTLTYSMYNPEIKDEKSQ